MTVSALNSTLQSHASRLFSFTQRAIEANEAARHARQIAGDMHLNSKQQLRSSAQTLQSGAAYMNAAKQASQIAQLCR